MSKSKSPPRKYYRLTEEGKRSLARFETDWTELKTAVEHILRKGAMDDGGYSESDDGRRHGRLEQ
ncbi:MAG: hypothetical protein A6D91_03515 [Bacillaceae bacterium G1]|nr:hypothetical protein [Bacillota bacterium]OJF17672.1 MAG: hypothetical protein A6D91_03515 [Bacillaceae bacterium G1]